MQDAMIEALVAKVEVELSKLSALVEGGAAAPTADLLASWRAVVAHLAIEPMPETRACPFCKGTIMRAATRCVHCWAQSAPPEA